MEQSKQTPMRWHFLLIGVAALLFAGIIYGWSILKAPLAAEFGWAAPDLALNFTLTMCFFCLGGMAAGIVSKRIGPKATIFIAAALACAGFLLTARLSGGSVFALYVTYGVMSGLGIGMAYNVIISCTGAWFPDKKGLCSGALMMGFGASALVLGNLASALMANPAVGWRTTFTLLGAALGVVLVVEGLIVRNPPVGTVFPQPKAKAAQGSEDFEIRDFTPGEMVRRPTFWRAFVCLVFLAAVGNTVISFARDLSISVGAGEGLATTLVGVLSVCNGLGRILTGALFDSMGRRKTMLLANGATILAALCTLLAVFTSSVPLCVAGLCLTGISYGSCPTISSAFISAFYGVKHFPVNFSIMNFNLMGASLMATVGSLLLTSSGGYVAPFLMLLALSIAALVLNISISRP